MALENPLATYIPQLQPADPTGQDSKEEGDDHIRQLKSVLQNQFSNIGNGAVTASYTELNALVGIDANVQTQLDGLNILQGYGGFTSGQTGDIFTIPPSGGGTWKTFVQAGASTYNDGTRVSVDAANGIINILAINPTFVRLHAVLTLELQGQPVGTHTMRGKFIRESGNNQILGGLMVSVTPDALSGVAAFVVECLDPTPASSGEAYHFELNQDYTQELDFEIRSVNIWAEVIGT